MTTVDTTPTADTPDTAATVTATLREAMTAFKAGDQVRARMLLQQTLDLDPHNQAAWVWLAAVTSDPVQQRECLECARDLDPTSEAGCRAQEMLARLGPAPAAQGSSGADTPAATVIEIPKLPVAPDIPDVPVESSTTSHKTGRRLSWDERIKGLFMSLLIGFVGIMMTIVTISGKKDLNEMEAIPVVTSVALSDLPPGRQVFVEGHISTHNDTRDEFVAYEYQQLERKRVRDEDGDYYWKETWHTRSTYTPAFLIDTSSGVVHVEKDYILLSAPHTQTKGDERRIGFHVGDRVAVQGTARQGRPGETAMSADLVLSGTKADYISSQRTNHNIVLGIGVCIIIVAVTLGAYITGIIPTLRKRLRAVMS